MTLKAKDLSPDQKMVIESLLGRSIAENEEISIRATTSPSVPEWLQTSWKSAQEQGLDRKSTRLNSSHVAISYAVFCLKKKEHNSCAVFRRTPRAGTPLRLHAQPHTQVPLRPARVPRPDELNVTQPVRELSDVAAAPLS